MRIRSATTDDFAEIARLFGSVEEAVLGRPSVLDATAVGDWLNAVVLETGSWVLEEGDAAVAAAFSQVKPGAEGFAGAVHPSVWGRGFGTRLVELAEAHLEKERAERAHTWTVAGDTAAERLFRGRGYEEVRRFWDMAVELDEEPLAPDLPIRTFREEDAPSFHAALQEAFEDHWEHRAEPFDEWWSRQRSRSGYDPSLWFLICDGEDVAGVIRNDLNYLGGGFVAALGVRRAWRGRGYGRALLLHSFREFRRRGMSRAALSVDASNATGATRLYESVGMHVELEMVVWERRFP